MDIAALSSERELRLGVYFWFRLFNVAPETTARFSHFDFQRRDHSPPCRAALHRVTSVPVRRGGTASSPNDVAHRQGAHPPRSAPLAARAMSRSASRLARSWRRS